MKTNLSSRRTRSTRLAMPRRYRREYRHSKRRGLTYEEFLRSKIVIALETGFEIEDSEIHPLLKPHQRAVVQWAIRGGKRAIFLAFGLGKSVVQLEIIRLVLKHADKWIKNSTGRGLIVLPLGVRQEFFHDAEMLWGQNKDAEIEEYLQQLETWEQFQADARNLNIPVRFVRRNEDVDAPGIYFTNYESVREGNLSPSLFDVTSLDEAATLRSSGSKTYHSFLSLFANVPFRFVATACPSPNDFIELLNYAGFLGIIDKSQAKTRWFNRDSQHADHLTLRENMKEEWWLWVHSWAVFLQKPSELGFSDEGYELPPFEVFYHELATGAAFEISDSRGQTKLFRDASAGVQHAAREKRDSLADRIAKMLEIIHEDEQTRPNAHYLLWHDLEDERRAIKAAIPEASEVYGTLEDDLKEERIIAFSRGLTRFLAAKPVMLGSGCNFQRHCSDAIFLGIGYKFSDFIQAIHRIFRFLQKNACRIHLIYTEAERPVLAILQEKWRKHDETVAEMSKLIKQYGLGTTGLVQTLARRLVKQDSRHEVTGANFRAICGDSVPATANMPDNSVDLICTSIPFGTQYEYSQTLNDFGHNESHENFFRQMDYLTPHLLRVLRPGRIFARHTKDRVNFGNYSGYGFASIEPFHADCIQHFRKHGFIYMGAIHVDTDVVKENNQSYRLGWTEVCKDGTKMGVGSPEYVLLFRKKPTDASNSYADIPVTRSKMEYTRARWQIDAHAHYKSSGLRLPTPEELVQLRAADIPRQWTIRNQEVPYDYWEHVRISEELEAREKLSKKFMTLPPVSHPDNDHIWSDVVRQLTLNGQQTQKGLDNHICPLQWDIADRIIDRYTNPDEVVFDPFAGLFTVPWRALKMGRKGIGVELNPAYFEDGVKYLQAAEQARETPSLFDFEDEKPEVLETPSESREFTLEQIAEIVEVAITDLPVTHPVLVIGEDEQPAVDVLANFTMSQMQPGPKRTKKGKVS